MEEPANMPELVSEFAAITGASPLVADHYLSACNYDLNRAVEFFFEHPPAPSQTGPAGARAAPSDDDDAAAMAALRDDANMNERDMELAGRGAAGDDDEELQRALAASMADAGPGSRADAGRQAGGAAASAAGGRPAGPRPAARRPQPDAEVLDDDDEDLPDADALLSAMARQREASLAAEREARARIDETMERMLGGLAGRRSGTVNPPANYPGPLGDLASIFPGMSAGLFPPGFAGPGGGSRPGPRGRDEGGEATGVRGRNASGGGSGGGSSVPGQSQQRRRVEVRRPDEEGGGSRGGAAGGRGAGGGWDEELELPEGMSRQELEEARMMEAALLGVPYEGRLPDFSGGAGGLGGRGSGGLLGAGDSEVAPEVLEHRELRWDQDRAYEESLAADRAKEKAAARAKAEAEAREREQREAEEAAVRAAAAEAARLAALVSAKTARLPAEPPSSAADAITVMVRLPDGSRHSRRFARTDRLSSLFDFVDVELDAAAKTAAAASDGAAATTSSGITTAADGSSTASAQQQLQPQSSLKPGSYNLVAQFPRRVFSEADSGGKTFEEAGLAGGGGAAFFVEPTGG